MKKLNGMAEVPASAVVILGSRKKMGAPAGPNSSTALKREALHLQTPTPIASRCFRRRGVVGKRLLLTKW